MTRLVILIAALGIACHFLHCEAEDTPQWGCWRVLRSATTRTSWEVCTRITWH